MTEAYEKLRNQFKELSFTDRVAFLAEASLMTGQSAVVSGMNLAGDLVDTLGSSVDSIAKAVGLTNGSGSGNVVSQTVERVAITVKDAGKAASTIYKDVAKGVDSVTGDVAKGAGDVVGKAADVVKDVAGQVQKTATQVIGGGQQAQQPKK